MYRIIVSSVLAAFFIIYTCLLTCRAHFSRNMGLLRTGCGQILAAIAAAIIAIINCLFVYFSLIQKVNTIFAQRFAQRKADLICDLAQ